MIWIIDWNLHLILNEIWTTYWSQHLVSGIAGLFEFTPSRKELLQSTIQDLDKASPTKVTNT